MHLQPLTFTMLAQAMPTQRQRQPNHNSPGPQATPSSTSYSITITSKGTAIIDNTSTMASFKDLVSSCVHFLNCRIY